MGKEFQLLLTVMLIAMSIGLYALSRTFGKIRRRSALAPGLALASFICLGVSGYMLSGLIPVVGNWVSFLFLAGAGLGTLVVLTGAYGK